ncbi:hypothetical protein B0H10DRAFT_979484 [Mycena sp. CBHHK59/15]|nr:hypothetical protein B0H10DRAFT_979484 [Mycena sp. CBHHK59/15]
MSPHNALLLSPARLSPLFVGSSLNLVLFTLELIQAFAYLGSKARRRDSVFIKLGVLLNLVSDLLGTMACCAVTYLYVVKFWGNTDALQKQFWPIVVVDFSVGVSALMAHFFMITRYWQMTKHHTISVFLVLILLAATAGTFGCGVLLALSPDDQSILLDQFSTLALLLHAVGASIIAILLLWQLYKRKDTPVTRWNFFQKTISSLIETGTVAAIVFAAAFGMWYGFRSQTVWIPFTFVVARVYSCTILFVLYTRKESTSNASGNAVEAGADQSK